MFMAITLKNKKLTTVGDSKGFTVNKAYIDNGQLLMDEEYDITIAKSQQKEVESNGTTTAAD